MSNFRSEEKHRLLTIGASLWWIRRSWRYRRTGSIQVMEEALATSVASDVLAKGCLGKKRIPVLRRSPRLVSFAAERSLRLISESARALFFRSVLISPEGSAVTSLVEVLRDLGYTIDNLQAHLREGYLRADSRHRQLDDYEVGCLVDEVRQEIDADPEGDKLYLTLDPQLREVTCLAMIRDS